MNEKQIDQIAPVERANPTPDLVTTTGCISPATTDEPVVKQCLIGCCRTIVASLLASVVLAALFGLINYLRSYGSPPELNAVAQASLYTKAGSSLITNLIDAYNSSFAVGYERFGSGIGVLGGAFWSMGKAKRYRTLSRIVIGLVTGFIIGFRLMMTITSDVNPVVYSGLIGALWTSVYLYMVGRPSKFSRLPSLSLKHS